jgi:hypothetical protein
MSDRIRSRAGFALPMTILVLVVLGIGLFGAMAFAASERRVIANIAMQETAFLVAQEGLDTFLSNRTALGFTGEPAASETVTLDLAQGTADVVLERLKPEAGNEPGLYVIRSTGTVPSARPEDPPARRTVAQMAKWRTSLVIPNAGWTSLTGLYKAGTAGTISGVDYCNAMPSVAGISVPDPPGYTQDGSFDPTGDPPLEEGGTVEELIEELGIDWEGIVNHTAITPDIVIPGGTWPLFASSAYWPIIHVTGDFELPGSGRGILIVSGGSLSISGGRTWEGIVLVGRNLTSNGNNTVYGMVVTGLDAMLADDPQAWAQALGQNSVGNGNKIYQYDSCSIASATESLGGFEVLDNAWMDNWPVE